MLTGALTSRGSAGRRRAGGGADPGHDGATTVADRHHRGRRKLEHDAAPFQRSVVLRALYALAPAAVSDLVAIGVVPVITLTPGLGSPLRVSGTAAAQAAVTIDVYQLSRRAAAGQPAAGPRSPGSVRAAGRAPSRGSYVIVARAVAGRRERWRAPRRPGGRVYERAGDLCAMSPIAQVYAFGVLHGARSRRSISAPSSAIAIRSCARLSRSRSVTVRSSSDWWSIVTAHGVPISSWRR